MSRLCAIAALLAAAAVGAPARAVDIRDPETEIAAALGELDNLANRLETAAQMSARQGLGPQNIAARRAFDHALEFFRHKEWLSVIRELNNFLNLTQVPEPGDYLKAQYMLGRAYDEIRLPARALRAYFRYISAYLTAPRRDEDELVEVLRRMVPLASLDGEASRQLRELLSSVTSLELPAEIRPEVMFIAAKAAARSGNRNLASTWLDTSLTTTTDPRLKAKALYVKALLALGNRDLDQAEETLSEVIQADDGKNGPDGYNTRDLARLALARIAVRKKRYDAAIRYYGLVPDDSAAYKDALFESIYVHLGRRLDDEARAKALLFVGRFPDASETIQLRTLLAYLDLRAGDLEAASASMGAADKQLDAIAKWMKQNMSGVATVDQSRLLDFIALSQPQLKLTPTIYEAQKLFARIAEVARRLADVEGEVRDMVYTLGRANIEQLRPRWANRAEQLAKLADETLAVGHRLAASERHLYASRFTPIETQQLKASETRRTNLLTPAAAAKRKVYYWAGLATFFDLTAEISTEHRKLAASRADLAAARYLLDHTQKKELRASREKRLDELEEQLSRATRATAVTLSRLRKEKIEHLIRQSPHHAARKFLAQYATALHEESGILQHTRGTPASTSEKLLAGDAAKAWKRWQYVVDRLFEGLDGLDAEVRAGIGEILHEVESHEQRHRELEARLATIQSDLERKLGLSLSSIVDRYGAVIDGRLARHRKWTADIEWLRFQEDERAGRRAKERFDLETQVLRDNLTDLQQGVLWKWPD